MKCCRSGMGMEYGDEANHMEFNKIQVLSAIVSTSAVADFLVG